MSNVTLSLRKKISGAKELRSVIRTMKAVAASNIEKYENSVRALIDYYRTVELGLGAYFRAHAAGVASGEPQEPIRHSQKEGSKGGAIGVVIFGSDQGLVGHFNDTISDFTIETLEAFSETQAKVSLWAVGERVCSQMTEAGYPPKGILAVPQSLQSVAPLVGQILRESQFEQQVTELHLFFNRPKSGQFYEPFHQRLLPLDKSWRSQMVQLAWPTKTSPEVLGPGPATLLDLVGEYLFVGLFRACVESLASENASRLAGMQRADKNIEEMLATLNGQYNHLRQTSIDEELFDLISGFEALALEDI